jgi:hypothetical protein
VNTPVQDALDEICRRGRINLWSFGVKGTITMRLGPISGLEALNRVAQEKNLVVDEVGGGVRRVCSQDASAVLQKIDDPEFKRKFIRLVQKGAARGELDKLAPVRHAVDHSANADWRLELANLGVVAPSEEVALKMMKVLPLTTTIGVYRVSFREVAAVFFDASDRPNYHFLSESPGVSLVPVKYRISGTN